jgi:hypothetical protein
MASPTTDRRFGLVGNTPYKAPVTVVATSNVTLSGQQTIDGIALLASNAAGRPDRVLCIGQTDTTQNGIWDVNTGSWTRSPDANGNYDFARGTQVIVTRGTAGAHQVYECTTAEPITLDSSSLTFAVSISSGFFPISAGQIDGLFHITEFGTLNNDGITDDSATWQAAIDSGSRVIDARGLNCKISATVNLASNQVILMQGTEITIAGTAFTCFSAVSKTNGALIGPFRITGDLVTNPGTGVSSAGILLQDCSHYRIDMPTVRKVKGYGILIKPGASTRSRADGNIITSPVVRENVWGMQDEPGSGAEYCTVIDVHATQNAQAGIVTAAGNIIWLGGHCVDNLLDGVRVQNGSNHAHGIVSAMNINHNPQYNIHCASVLNGQSFEGCHIYANNASAQGAIFLETSEGIRISGGILDCQIYNYKDGSSGINVIDGCYCPGDYGIARLAGSNNGHDQLIIRNCFGPGSYAIAGGIDTTGDTINDPSLCYVLAERAAGSTQALTSGVQADLIWPSEPFRDRRLAYLTTSGVFQPPANLGGLYTVSFDAVFTGTALSATASFVEALVNGVTKKVFQASGSSARIAAQGSWDLVLTTTQALKLAATVVGTTPSFGDATWPSNFNVRRIA